MTHRHDEPPLLTPPRSLQWNETPLFSSPAPPTGPEGRVPTEHEGRRAAYLQWRKSLDGASAWAWITDRARGLLASGSTRISAKALVEDCRAALKVEINNTWTAWIADDLVAAHPALLEVVERRRRRKA